MIRHKTRWTLAGLLWLALWASATHGQSPQLMDAFNRVSELFSQGRYHEAIPFAEEALRLSEEELSSDHPFTATQINNLAAVFQGQGRHADSESLHERALAIREKTLGLEHLEVATSLNNLARLYYIGQIQ